MSEERTCGNCATFFPKSNLCKAYKFRCEVCANNKACAKWKEGKALAVVKKTQRTRCSWMPYVWQYFCPHCKKQLGWANAEKKPDVCSMCGKKISWEGVVK